MSNSCNQIEEIKSLICSNKPLAYSTLLHLQEQSISDPCSLQTLVDASQSLISAVSVDILIEDEEIAAQALKCLGFMIYHPALVSTISADDASMVLKQLAKAIICTKIKSVCNLGVWCISMQQFDASVLAGHFHLVLQAVVHALDNPFGSLSTTFEAMQAIMKLTAPLSEKMRESSHIWAPPIYRRMLSNDKRERDMSERCLLKIRPTIFPAPAALSKALAEDMKLKLLSEMKDFLNQGMKVQTMQAWGWFIRLLGSHAMKNRHLINDMLKIPEKTFSDNNPQVQIASQVAWEGLIDALLYPPILTCEINRAFKNCVQEMQTAGQASGLSKSIKLIMTPLICIISSKCDVSVYSSCLNTWCYLLQKLDIHVNHPSVIKLVLVPMFEAVFRFGPDIKTIWLWNLCLDLLDDFILAKCGNIDQENDIQVSNHSLSEKCSWKQHPIKWLPWAVCQLDFFIKMINVIISHASIATITPENKNAACDAALRIFRSVLKGVQIEFKSSSTNYNDVVLCLNTILRFIKKTCEDVICEGSDSNGLCCTSLHFVEVVTEELEPSILGSPLYKVALDLYQLVDGIGNEKILGTQAVNYMAMVSPLAYLIAVCMCVVIPSTSVAQRKELILQRLQKFFKRTLFSYGILENLHMTVGLLYKHMGRRYLQFWIEIAKGLKDCIKDVKNLSLLKMDSDRDGYLTICHLLSYPFVVYSCPQQKMISEESSGSSEESDVSERKCELQLVAEAWKSLYGTLCASELNNCSETYSLPEGLCSMLNGCIDQNIIMVGCGTKGESGTKDSNLLFLSAESVTCIMEKQILTLAPSSNGSSAIHAGGSIFNGINNSLQFAARFLKLSLSKIEADTSTVHLVTSRVFSVLGCFIRCLQMRQSILLFIEIITCPLVQWLSNKEVQEASINEQLQHLWIEILNCLRNCQPPITFDSSLLKLQAPLLEKTLVHPNPSISEPTITFWNSTYGKQMKLDYPESLLDVLDKLSRNKRISLHKKSRPFLVKCHSISEAAYPRYRMIATNNWVSKRVELVEDTTNQIEQQHKLYPSPKRKRLELTEHQKEVRCAQQGRGMDCGGHGPGTRTYTSVDYSQGNEDSQESQELRDPESILEMLRRVA